LYGFSASSSIGNGAIILTFPDSPINLKEDALLRTATSISLTWNQGAANGGAAVLDYRVSFD